MFKGKIPYKGIERVRFIDFPSTVKIIFESHIRE